MRPKTPTAMMMLALFAQMLCATSVYAAGLEVENAFARAVLPGAPMGAIYARLTNADDHALEIVRVYSEVAKISEIHESLEIDGMMRMRKVEPFLIPGSTYVDLKPGGKHVMLMMLQRQLKTGDSFIVVFVDSKGTEYKSEVLVGGFGQMTMPKT